MGDVTRRKLAGDANDRAYGVQGMRDATTNRNQDLKTGLGYDQMGQKQEFHDADFEQRAGFHAEKMAKDYYGIERADERAGNVEQGRNSRFQQGQDASDSRFQQGQAEKAQRAKEYQAFRQRMAEIAQAERSANAQQQQQLQMFKQALHTKLDERRTNENRAKLGDGNAAARIVQLNNEIMQMLGTGQNPFQQQPQPQQAPPVNYGQPGSVSPYDNPPADLSGQVGPQASNDPPIQLQTDGQWNRLLPGTVYIAPDGQKRVKQ